MSQQKDTKNQSTQSNKTQQSQQPNQKGQTKYSADARKNDSARKEAPNAQRKGQ